MSVAPAGGRRTAVRDRWFVAALWLTSLFAVGHLLGFVQATFAARHDPALSELTAAMRAYTLPPILGMRPSLLDLREYFSLCFSLLLALLVVVGWLCHRARASAPRLVAQIATAYAWGLLAITAASLSFRIAQGVVSGGLILAVFTMAARRSRAG